MVQVAEDCGTITLSRSHIRFRIPPMPACWDSLEEWEGWCRLMALTYRQEYSHNRTLQEALHNFCIDCVPGIVQNLMIRSGRCKKYTYLEPQGSG